MATVRTTITIDEELHKELINLSAITADTASKEFTVADIATNPIWKPKDLVNMFGVEQVLSCIKNPILSKSKVI